MLVTQVRSGSLPNDAPLAGVSIFCLQTVDKRESVQHSALCFNKLPCRRLPHETWVAKKHTDSASAAPEGSYSRLASADFSFRAGLSSDSMVLAQGMGCSILAPDLNSGCSEQLLLRQHLDSL